MGGGGKRGWGGGAVAFSQKKMKIAMGWDPSQFHLLRVTENIMGMVATAL